jgi:hypothetical protein
VGVLAPDGALALTPPTSISGPVRKRYPLYDWVLAIGAAVRAIDPALILPGDDFTLRTLLQLVLEPPPELAPALEGGLGALIHASLGDARQCLAAIDKAELFLYATDDGIAVAEGGVAADRAEAVAIAARVGYPVVVRRDFRIGGAGRCAATTRVKSSPHGRRFGQDAWVPHSAPRVCSAIDGEITRPFSLARQESRASLGRASPRPRSVPVR